MPEPSAPNSGGFLMKKWGPLPIAAYVVAGAALIGFFILRRKSGSASSSTSPGPIAAAPTGIQDPTTDQNAGLIATLNDIETSLHGNGTVATGTVGPSDNPFSSWFAATSAIKNKQGQSQYWVPPGQGFIEWSKNVFNAYSIESGNPAGTPSGVDWNQLTTYYQQQSAPSAVSTKPSPAYLPPAQKILLGGTGGGEAPERILPDYVLRQPVHLDTEMTRRPPVLTQPR